MKMKGKMLTARKLLALVFLLGALGVLGPASIAMSQDRTGLTKLPVDHSLNLRNWHHDDKRVSAYSGGMENLFDFHVVKKGPIASALPIATDHPLPVGRIDKYLAGNRVMGLMIIKDGEIVLERYQFGKTASHRFQSKSMVKSVVSLLIGIAMEEGKIASIDDLAKGYLPELEDHPYGNTSIRHLLQMSSGIEFTEMNFKGDPGSRDVSELERASWRGHGPGGVNTVMPFQNNRRISEPGTKFQYASAETQVLGLILRKAVGKSLSDYLSEKIWQPMGAEAGATWWIDRSGHEPSYDGLGATLRDYARLGNLLAHDGAVDGVQIVPKKWVLEATQPTPGYPHLKPNFATSYMGYGYQFWVMPTQRRQFAMLGAQGQAVFVDPELKLVVVQSAAFRRGASMRKTHGLWRRIVETYQR